MIKVKLFINGENLSGFCITGHADYSRGDDIVCASVSSAAYMTVNTVTDIIHASAEASDGDGAMKLMIYSPSEKTETVLRGFELHIRELAEQYPRNIKVIYGGVENA